MAKVIMTTEDEILFEDIFSFKTDSCVGIWDNAKEDFMLIKRTNICFEPWYLHKENKEYKDLGSLDAAVYDLCDEHITDVFDRSDYEIKLL